MSKSFLGRGIAFPLQVDGTGNVAMSAYERNIEECIRLVLGTAPGERLYRPLFGCKLHDLIFEPNNSTTRGLASTYVREALVKWEPRIQDIEVHARRDPDAENSVLIDIHYAVRATNNMFNLVYPFYLRREEDL